jgi:hypothetical protein
MKEVFLGENDHGSAPLTEADVDAEKFVRLLPGPPQTMYSAQ